MSSILLLEITFLDLKKNKKSETYYNRFCDKSIEYIIQVFKTDLEPTNEIGNTGDIAQCGKIYYIRYPDGWRLAEMRLDEKNRPTQPHPTLGSCRRLDVGTMNWRSLTSWNSARGEKKGGDGSNSLQSTSMEHLKRKGISYKTDLQRKKSKVEITEYALNPSSCG